MHFRQGETSDMTSIILNEHKIAFESHVTHKQKGMDGGE